MSARDINSCLVVHAKVSSLSTMPDLNLFKEKKKIRSQHEAHSVCRGPHELCLKIQQKCPHPMHEVLCMNA
jgi:hypothetical protein